MAAALETQNLTSTAMTTTKKKPVMLIILDGLGIGPKDDTNAVHIANTPVLDQLGSTCPVSALRADGEFVGVIPGQMGNSEVGHMTIGAGRVIKQSLPKISEGFLNGDFTNSPGYQSFAQESETSRAIHLVGLLSDGGIHSHSDHVYKLCQHFNRVNKPVFLHSYTDGRDTGAQAGQEQLKAFAARIKDLENVHMATLVGRYNGMDRDNNWNRVQTSWDLFTKLKGERFDNVEAAFLAAYKKGGDEHMPASVLNLPDSLDPRIQDGDSVLLYNFRADRARQITRCFLGLDGIGFECNTPKLNAVATMTPYDAEFDQYAHIIYPNEQPANTLGEVIANAGLTQLRTAETEKYPHVTFFANGGREEPFPNETRLLVPSPKVSTYDLKPEMSLPELTDEVVKTINANTNDFIMLNIANPDMVGHTGNFNAAVQAVEHTDRALGRILEALKQAGGEALIIADHGNIEQMLVDGKPCTTHTSNPIPCIYVGEGQWKLKSGSLADVAPTILRLMELENPKEMTGKPLLEPLQG